MASETIGGSSTGSLRPREDIHPEQIEMTSNGSTIEAPRGIRAKQLNNAKTGDSNDIITMILANGASYDLKERVVLRRLSLEMRVEVGKRQQAGDSGLLQRRPVTANLRTLWLNSSYS
jgi:hypothetical protein